ncbi:MAG: hypothetical protein A2X61_07040 [Ignavibacteria bacterium GWB2_35_12]|nr:MAG: hypothetical protein A2X61_07040 [Ignavibacteria bacterium GWB2_35_12]OGU88222.1 MAG: hypothetical protein A2220_14595 [Ignavibacteria bacterium RIFOXYA2_FULL_35_10]OGV23267.1 MAG: hypothetical protein A2475_13515 [Ignavibacteria bacterium RIFOXYC2_FULL_35_21]
MKNTLQKTHTFFLQLHIVWFVLIMIPIIFLIRYFFGSILCLFNVELVNPWVNIKIHLNLFIFILLLVLFIPFAFLETTIFQYLVFKISRKIKYLEKKVIVIILISSFLFGIAHFSYDIPYQIFAFFNGIPFAYSYFVAEEKKIHPILIVSLIHYLVNVLSLSLIYIL